MTWDEDNQIFWPKKPFASWVKNTYNCEISFWDSPIGDAPALIAEQTSQNVQVLINGFMTGMNQAKPWDLTDRMA